MGNAATSLPYTIGNQVSAGDEKFGGWALHAGSRKSDSANVTVFVAKKPALAKTPVDRARAPSMMQLEPALHHFSHCKRLRHPHILNVHATLDTDNPTEGTTAQSSASSTAKTGDLIIVTEPCIPLEAWLQTNPPPEQLAWGLEAMVRALHFLHASANLAHGNVAPQSFFVTSAGDVKLWNFSLVGAIDPGLGMTQHFKDWEGLVTPPAFRSPERQERRYDALANAGVHAMDSFSVGVMINFIFGGQIPAQLVKACQRMQTPNLKMRPRLQPLLKCPVFDTPYQKLQLQLEEFTIQPVEQKIAFWQNLTPSMQAGLVPQQLSVHRLLPLIKQTITTVCNSDSMKSQDMYRREVQATMQPMFYIAETYLGDKTSQELGPMVAVLFGVNDRAVRGFLLQRTSFLIQHLDNNMLNQSVFEPACGGFSDSSATLRELTLKATVEIMPKLTQPNLEKLSRYLVRLQGDNEQGLRTNTIIVFGKLAPYLTENSRQKLLLPAFIRALKDPFIPCRLSALKCVLKGKEFFTPTEIAAKVLPTVMPYLLDGSKDVRKEAFVVVDDLVFSLRQESEKMGDNKPVPAPAPTSGNAVVAPAPQPKAAAPVAPAPSSGSYFSSWMGGSSSTSTATRAPVAPPPQPATRVVPPPVAPTPAVASLQLNNANVDVSDGWGDDDDDDAFDAIKTDISPAAKANIQYNARPVRNEDDFFNAFDTRQKAKPASLGLQSKGKLTVPKPKPKKEAAPKPAVTKLAVDIDLDDGWDDF